jgi:Uma2 family endonuclease
MATTASITTAEQLLHAPGLGRCELLRGELIMMSPAGSEHGSVVASITAPLTVFVKQHRLGTVFGAETGFQISRDPDTVRAPDVAFVRAERVAPKPPKGFFPGAPDLAVEVVSPDDRAGKVSAKVQDWLAAGCAVVWVVDSDAQTVTVHGRAHEPIVLAASDTLVGGELLPGFRMPVAEVFAP